MSAAERGPRAAAPTGGHVRNRTHKSGARHLAAPRSCYTRGSNGGVDVEVLDVAGVGLDDLLVQREGAAHQHVEGVDVARVLRRCRSPGRHQAIAGFVLDFLT